MNVVIYSKDRCGYCEMAIKLTELKKHDSVVKKLDVDFTREELLELFPTAKSFPQIVVDGKHIGGYNEYARYLQETKQQD